MKAENFQKTKNNLLQILERNSKIDLDLKENENLILELENFEMNEQEDFKACTINFITTLGQHGFYKLITDHEQNFKDEFFVII